MHDRKPVRSVLLLLLPVLLLAAGYIFAGQSVQDVLFAVMKLVVIG